MEGRRMLHKRRLPDPEAEDLRRVYETKLHFLYWLLRNTPPVGFGFTELESKFDQLLGKWLADRIKWHGELTSFGKDVYALRDLADKDSSGAEDCAKAIENDAKFDVNWDMPGFSMQFATLPEIWRNAVKAVCLP